MEKRVLSATLIIGRLKLGVSSRQTSIQLFELIEKKGSVTADEVAAKFGIKRASAAVILSRWCSRGFLKLHRSERKVGERYKPSSGSYSIGVLAWSDRFYGKRHALDDFVMKEIRRVISRGSGVTIGEIVSVTGYPVKVVRRTISQMGNLQTRITDNRLLYKEVEH